MEMKPSPDNASLVRDCSPGVPRASGAEAVVGTVRSVQRAFDLLDCLAPGSGGIAPGGATLTDLAQRSGLATTTVKRLLDTLEGDAVLTRLPDGRYIPGQRLIGIAISALQSVDLYEVVQRHLNRLSQETGETANFGILNDDGNVLYLRQAQSARTLRHASWLGRAFPPGRTAVGRALRGKVDADGAVSTRKTLEPDVTAIAAPIYGLPGTAPGGGRRGEESSDSTKGPVVGALSITGPTSRIDEAVLAHCRRLVAAAARDVTRETGAHWPHDVPEHAPEPAEAAE